MGLRRIIFLRTVALLGGLVLATAVLYTLFIIRQNRAVWDEHTRQQLTFVADQSERLILWDDRVALRALLISLVESSPQLDYAFIEMYGTPFADTFGQGVPSGLLGRGAMQGEVICFKFKDGNGAIYYDYSFREDFSGAVIHLGMSRVKVDKMASGVIVAVALFSGALMLLCMIPGWLVSSAITREVARMNTELNLINSELEARVRERTSELSEANEALIREADARKGLEKQRDDFLSMVRHDMATPLSVIYGYADLMRKSLGGQLDEDSAHMLNAIESNAQSLTRMIDDMTEMSRLESGGIAPDLEPVDLGNIAAEVYMSLKMRADAKGVVLKNKAAGLPGITVDRYYVARAASNLVLNAVNYTPAGGTVVIETGVKEGEGGRMAYISVSDTGPGIPADERESVFSKYYRSSRTASVPGRGLGLAIVKAVMDAHCGLVELDSEPGKGSTFRLLFNA